ncbi:hypothetical protein [Geobacter sp. DSM 9736]|uniref:hypothetical protein n=1 Tax=Geobacter sp. DSM 9736 TaxID=1277350 RepID=UPI000B50DEE2|nr:hypothetical protein [Geobacter sp. DSM 9736]SNB45312.1 hypothetical protein SAMN06269301_0719 [Geobacter sp. DSM 9736]
MKIRQIRTLPWLFILLMFIPTHLLAAVKSTTGITQGQFAAMLVSTFRWEQALPDVPREADYLSILEGRRIFRMEAEEYYDKRKDNASVKEYPLYGSFTGSGWVSGVSTPTTVHFHLILPNEGDYMLIVSSKGESQQWKAGGKTFLVNAGDRLKENVAGTVHLKAGAQEISVVLPPEGAIDYLVLEAPPLAPISPLKGWKFNEPVTMGDVAEVAASLLGWEGLLPDDGNKPVDMAVAEAAKLPPAATTTDVQYLGPFHAKQWVRAGFAPVWLHVPFTVEAPAVYRIKLNALGERLAVELDGNRMVKEGKPYLDWIDLGLHRLSEGTHTIGIDLGPRGGADVVRLEKKKSSPADYLAATGLQGKPSDPVTREQADKILTSLAERFTERK